MYYTTHLQQQKRVEKFFYFMFYVLYRTQIYTHTLLGVHWFIILCLNDFFTYGILTILPVYINFV